MNLDKTGKIRVLYKVRSVNLLWISNFYVYWTIIRERLRKKLLNIQEVADELQVSVSTIRRRIAESRKGLSTFPASVFGQNRKGLWRKEDIEIWCENTPSVPNVPHVESPAAVKARLKAVRNDLLREFGIDLTSNTETN